VQDSRDVDVRLRAQRRGRIAEAVLLVAVAIVVTLVFGLTTVDIDAARVFYRPTPLDHWPLARRLPWSALYSAAPWITASLVIGALVTLALSLVYDRRIWRRHAVFVLLSVVIGPGLLGNAVFKDHWNRPRPRDIIEFAGPLHYIPAPLPTGEEGASFPCGHCTVGFLYGAGWWIWKHRRPTWARTSLALGLLTGLALGLGRMAAGGHFLSDVIWSALLAFGVCHVLHYDALRTFGADPAIAAVAAACLRSSRFQRALVLVAALGGVGILAALFATPHGTSLSASVPFSSLPSTPRVLDVEAKRANIDIVLVDTPASQLSIVGELHGFGLPMSRLEPHIGFQLEPVPTLRYRIEQHGWFTDLDGLARLIVPASGLHRVVVRLGTGNITDATRAGVVKKAAVLLDLSTDDGRVQPAGD
jgi:lipid A 4'-phosphatase